MTDSGAPAVTPESQQLVVNPIGVVRSDFVERADAPRQPLTGNESRGTIELFNAPGIEHALDDLGSFRHIWVLFWFHLNQSWRPKVLPPRSEKRRGVFATRSPYRPNPIGLSVVELLRIDGLRLEVGSLDILDGSPVLDLKPYLPYADIVQDAGSGWLHAPHLGSDPVGQNQVQLSPLAEQQLKFLRDEHGIDLGPRLQATLSAGATPSAYRRIKKQADGYTLAYKTWRVHYQLADQVVVVSHIGSGLKSRDVRAATEGEHLAHQQLLERFGRSGSQ
jgi:tRNA (adenine37-N6)-methyltransferase